MIENLNGIYETVNYRENTNIRLYDNTDFEEYPPHWHTAAEIIMPIKNSYPLTYGDISLELKEGEILLICPGTLHHLNAARGQRIIFQAELSAVAFLSEIDTLMGSLSPGLLISPETYPGEYSRIKVLMEEITSEYTASSSYYETLICARMLELFALIGRSEMTMNSTFQAGSIKQSEYREKFMDICSYIGEHCSEELSLEDVADRCGFSKYHFSRLFKQYANVSFYKYLNQKRIAKAEKLLIDPNMSVTEVSLACGFSSLSSFIRMFKIIKNCTPSQYRNLYESPEQ